jgi:hypothetical protein
VQFAKDTVILLKWINAMLVTPEYFAKINKVEKKYEIYGLWDSNYQDYSL